MREFARPGVQAICTVDPHFAVTWNLPAIHSKSKKRCREAPLRLDRIVIVELQFKDAWKSAGTELKVGEL